MKQTSFVHSALGPTVSGSGDSVSDEAGTAHLSEPDFLFMVKTVCAKQLKMDWLRSQKKPVK